MDQGILLEAGTNELEILSFKLGSTPFAINVAKVREIIQPCKTIAIPYTPDAIAGSFKNRDEILTLINLGRYFGMEGDEVRQGQVEPAVLTCADLRILPQTHQVFRGQQEIPLTTKEFALLYHLMRHKGMVVTQSNIIEKVWDVNFDVFSDVLKVMISRLRKKLEAEGRVTLIEFLKPSAKQMGPSFAMLDP